MGLKATKRKGQVADKHRNTWPEWRDSGFSAFWFVALLKTAEADKKSRLNSSCNSDRFMGFVAVEEAKKGMLLVQEEKIPFLGRLHFLYSLFDYEHFGHE